MKDILEKLYIYSTNAKIIDKKIIEELIHYFVFSYGISDYVKKVEIFKQKMVCNPIPYISEKGVAEYDFATKTIHIYDRFNLYLKYLENWIYKLTPLEYYMYLNILVFQGVVHELVHALHYKVYESEEKDTKSILIRESYDSIENGNKNKSQHLSNSIYSQIYWTIPIEKMAELDSLRMIIESTNFSNMPTLLQILNKTYIQIQLKGYIYSCPPTEYFLEIVGKKNVWEDFEFYSYNSRKLMQKVTEIFGLEDRVYLGLPINPSEYTLMKKQFKNIKIRDLNI